MPRDEKEKTPMPMYSKFKLVEAEIYALRLICSAYDEQFDQLDDAHKARYRAYIMALHQRHEVRKEIDNGDWTIPERKLQELARIH